MESIIKELWLGNIIPQDDSRTKPKEMKELLGYMSRIRIPKEYCQVIRYYYSRYQAEQFPQTIPRTAKDSRKDLQRRAKRDHRKVPRLLE